VTALENIEDNVMVDGLVSPSLSGYAAAGLG